MHVSAPGVHRFSMQDVVLSCNPSCGPCRVWLFSQLHAHAHTWLTSGALNTFSCSVLSPGARGGVQIRDPCLHSELESMCRSVCGSEEVRHKEGLFLCACGGVIMHLIYLSLTLFTYNEDICINNILASTHYKDVGEAITSGIKQRHKDASAAVHEGWSRKSLSWNRRRSSVLLAMHYGILRLTK